MKRRLVFFFLLVSPSPSLSVSQSTDLSRGIDAFEQRRLTEAMGAFVEALRQDPSNSQAHAYLNLIAREMENRQRISAQEKRLQWLAELSKRLEANHQDTAFLEKAILDTTQAEERARQERWHAWCEEARMERDLGHLLSANDLVLRVLKENASDAEAQRQLSELQSRLKTALESAANLSVVDRYAYEGFYAYGQADYAASLTSWSKARAVLAQSTGPGEMPKKLQALRFESYAADAQARVVQEEHRAILRALFQNALSFYQEGRFTKALDLFRQLAIQDPEYPQLGFYLVQAEAAAEKDRARRLGEEKRQEVALKFKSGMSQLEQEHYREAEQAFGEVLALDPTHPQANAYLAMVRAEMKRRHDPKAAQMHYEAGLIAYASGKLDEAVREWRVAARMDPRHDKALNALAKVQKELALYREVP